MLTDSLEDVSTLDLKDKRIAINQNNISTCSDILYGEKSIGSLPRDIVSSRFLKMLSEQQREKIKSIELIEFRLITLKPTSCRASYGAGLAGVSWTLAIVANAMADGSKFQSVQVPQMYTNMDGMYAKIALNINENRVAGEGFENRNDYTSGKPTHKALAVQAEKAIMKDCSILKIDRSFRFITKPAKMTSLRSAFSGDVIL